MCEGLAWPPLARPLARVRRAGQVLQQYSLLICRLDACFVCIFSHHTVDGGRTGFCAPSRQRDSTYRNGSDAQCCAKLHNRRVDTLCRAVGGRTGPEQAVRLGHTCEHPSVPLLSGTMRKPLEGSRRSSRKLTPADRPGCGLAAGTAAAAATAASAHAPTSRVRPTDRVPAAPTVVAQLRSRAAPPQQASSSSFWCSSGPRGATVAAR